MFKTIYQVASLYIRQRILNINGLYAQNYVVYVDLCFWTTITFQNDSVVKMKSYCYNMLLTLVIWYAPDEIFTSTIRSTGSEES